jgi:spermidine synthase
MASTEQQHSGTNLALANHGQDAYGAPSLSAAVLILFTLSGMTALVYQVVWRRMLSVSLGGSIYATSAVLAAFMGGLCLGSIVVGRCADRWKNPLRAYGVFEILIAAFALTVPALCGGLVWLERSLYASLSQTSSPESFVPLQESSARLTGVKFLASFVLLLFPTFLMGGTLPLLSKFYIRSRITVEKGLGRLYSVNTFGAVLGAALAGFVLIKHLGASGANLAAIALNAAVGIAAVALSRGISVQPSAPVTVAPSEEPRASSRRRVVLLLFALSGFTALSYEVLWTRVLVYVVGNTTYSFTIMLSSFLFGIALGASLFAKYLARGEELLARVGAMEVLIGVFALTGMVLTRSFYPIFQSLKQVFVFWSYWPYTLVRYLIAVAALLPQAVLFGMVFPAVTSSYAGRRQRVAGDIGRAYASNTVGAVFGSVCAVFVLIPLFGLAGTITLMAFLNVLIGSVFMGLSTRYSPRRRLAFASAMLVVFALLVTALPPRIEVGSGSEGIHGERGQLLFYKEGSAGTVAVFLDTEQGLKMMEIDGNPQVPTDLDALQAFHLLGHLPFFVHSNPIAVAQASPPVSARDVLVTAFGGGITTGAILMHPVERVDAVEICPSVFEAARYFADENNGALEDKRLRLITADANNYVKVTGRTYDIIASDATHPGASESWVLYTRDFYDACRQRLREGGVMCQWVPLHSLSTTDLKTILRTFQEVFPHASLWFARGYTIILGTPQPLVIDAERINKFLQEGGAMRALFRRVHLESVPALLKNLVLEEESFRRFAAGATIATEDNSPLAFAEERAFGGYSIPANIAALTDAMSDRFPEILNATEHEEKGIEAVVAIRRQYLKATQSWYERKPVEGLRYLEEAYASGIGEDADLAWYLRWMSIMASRRYLKSGDVEEGLSRFRRWAEVFPQSPWTRVGLGHLLLEEALFGEKPALIGEGLAELAKGVELAPGDPVVLHEVSQAFLSVGKDVEAIPFLEKYVKALPDDPTVWRNLVGAYLRAGEFEKAIPFMEKLAAAYPRDPIAWSTLAGAYQAIQDYTTAERALRKALELDPQNPVFQFELQRLESLKDDESSPPDEAPDPDTGSDQPPPP